LAAFLGGGALALVLLFLALGVTAARRQRDELWKEVADLRWRILELENPPRPHLVFRGTQRAPATFVYQSVPFPAGVMGPVMSMTATGTGPPGPTAGGTVSADAGPTQPIGASPVIHDFVRVFVANDPPAGAVGAVAEKVFANVAFVAVKGDTALEMLARWAEAPQRAQTGHVGISLDDAQLDIEPNGLAHPLDIAMKRRGDICFYAVNSENSAATEFCLPKHELTYPEYIVRVSLRGSNTDEVVGEFILRNEGFGGTISLESRDPRP
jgi:hypothetical protein